MNNWIVNYKPKSFDEILGQDNVIKMINELLVVAAIILNWSLNNFVDLNLIDVLLPVIHFISVPGLLAVGLLGLHVFKKSEQE